jgi:hypothetical protein
MKITAKITHSLIAAVANMSKFMDWTAKWIPYEPTPTANHGGINKNSLFMYSELLAISVAFFHLELAFLKENKYHSSQKQFLESDFSKATS